MALTKAEVQVQWSAANSIALDDGASIESDTITPNANAGPEATLHVKADSTAGAALAATDIIDVYMVYSGGDPDGTGSDEFDTSAHATPVMSINLFATTGGEEPAQRSVKVSILCKAYKVRLTSRSAVTDRVTTCSACLTEMRSA